MHTEQRLYKRLFDLGCSLVLLLFLLVPMMILVLLASIDTRTWGLFVQTRIGQHGRPFTLYKIRTYRRCSDTEAHISRFGRFLRIHKWDELPQLFHILFGQMSFVGPRPDLPGFADALEGEDRIILSVKPGLTGPASLKYKDEATLLAAQPDPDTYNRTVIWPDKVKINKKYVQSWRFSLDLAYIYQSIAF